MEPIFDIEDESIADDEYVENMQVADFNVSPCYQYIADVAASGDYISLLEYIGSDIEHLYDLDELERALLIASEVDFLPFDVEREYMTYLTKEEDTFFIIRSTPVMLALHIKRYDLARKLLEHNHPSNIDQHSFYVAIEGKEAGRVRFINLYHYVVCDKKIPIDLIEELDRNSWVFPKAYEVFEKVPTDFMGIGMDPCNRIYEHCCCYRDYLFEERLEEIAGFTNVTSTDLNEDLLIEIQSRFIMSFREEGERLDKILEEVSSQVLYQPLEKKAFILFNLANIVKSRRRVLRALKGEYKKKMAQIIIKDYLRLTKFIRAETASKPILREHLDTFFLEALKYAYSKEFFMELIKEHTNMQEPSYLEEMIIQIADYKKEHVPVLLDGKALEMLHLMYINEGNDLRFLMMLESIKVEKEVDGYGNPEGDNEAKEKLFLSDIVHFANPDMVIEGFKSGLFSKEAIVDGLDYAMEFDKMDMVPALLAVIG